jgi:hypothetical protein
MAVLPIQNFPAPALILSQNFASTASVTMDAATPTCFAYSFIAPKNPFGGTLSMSEFRWKAATPTGNPKVTPYIYSDNAGVPGSPVANGTGVESGVISAGQVDSAWTGTLPALTEGTQYWVVLKCTSGTSVIIQYYYNSGTLLGCPGITGSSSAGSGISWRATVDSGVIDTWAGSNIAGAVGVRIKITDGTDTAYSGLQITAVAAAQTGASSRCYGTQQPGFVVTTPANGLVRVKSVIMPIGKTGTGQGALCCKVFAGTSTTATATSRTIPEANIDPGDLTTYQFTFSSPVELAAGSVYRFVISAAAGDSSNYYFIYGVTIDSDAQSLALKPWGISLCVLDTTWDADTTTTMPLAGIILDSIQPFGVPSGDFPDPGNVTEDDTTNGVTGTYHEATEAEVQSGVHFGASSALTGSYVGGGGSGRPEIRGGNL